MSLLTYYIVAGPRDGDIIAAFQSEKLAIAYRDKYYPMNRIIKPKQPIK